MVEFMTHDETARPLVLFQGPAQSVRWRIFLRDDFTLTDDISKGQRLLCLRIDDQSASRNCAAAAGKNEFQVVADCLH